MAKVQLLFGGEGNREAMASLVAERHTPITARDLRPADLYLVSEESFRAYRSALERRKSEQDPVFCPVVLVRRENAPVRVELSDIEERDGPLLVNDVVTAPVRRQALFRTLSNLLARREQTEALVDDLRERNERLEEEREKYRTLVEHSEDGIAVVQGGSFTFVNERMAEITGVDRSTLRGTSAAEIFPEEHREKVGAHYERFLVGEEYRHRTEVPIVTATGRKQIDLRASRIRYDGDPAVMALFRDVTERRERERDLRRLENAVEHAGHAILITDPDGTIEYVNPAFEEMTGYTAAEAIGEDPSLLKSGAHGEEFYADLWDTILGGEVWTSETVNERKSGERLVLNQTIAPIQDGDGTNQGFVAIQDDITYRRLREQQLAVFDRVLRHNLRNKGTAIQGYADLLQQSLGEDALVDHLDAIQDNIASLLEISEKARQARQAFGELSESDPNRDLLASIERLTERVGSLYPDAEIELEADRAVSPEIGSRVTPALRELVENAAKHSDADTPRVLISVTVRGSTATVTIEDNGSGIPTDERRAIESGTEDPLEHGSGLGLWFAYWLISYAGGDVAIDAGPQGTAVEVTIPTL